MDSDEDNDNEEFATINSDLIDFDIVSSTHTGCNTGIARTTVNNILHPNDQSFEMCHQLNEKQQRLFNFMMRYAIKCRLAEKYDKLMMNQMHFTYF